jgi:hypothetical protein
MSTFTLLCLHCYHTPLDNAQAAGAHADGKQGQIDQSGQAAESDYSGSGSV